MEGLKECWTHICLTLRCFLVMPVAGYNKIGGWGSALREIILIDHFHLVWQMPSKTKVQAESTFLCAMKWTGRFLHGQGDQGKQSSHVLKAE